MLDITRTIKAKNFIFDDWPEYAEPGLVQIWGRENDICALIFTCPGCGKFGSIRVGFTDKPKSPSWKFENGDQGNAETWSLSPSIHCIGCCGWHGFFKEGIFKSC